MSAAPGAGRTWVLGIIAASLVYATLNPSVLAIFDPQQPTLTGQIGRAALHSESWVQDRFFATALRDLAAHPDDFRLALGSGITAAWATRIADHTLRQTGALPPDAAAYRDADLMLTWPVLANNTPRPIHVSTSRLRPTTADVVMFGPDPDFADYAPSATLQAPLPGVYRVSEPDRYDGPIREWIDPTAMRPNFPSLEPFARICAMSLAAGLPLDDLAACQRIAGIAFVRESWEALPEPVEALRFYSWPGPNAQFPPVALAPVVAGEVRWDFGFFTTTPPAQSLRWETRLDDPALLWIRRAEIPITSDPLP